MLQDLVKRALYGSGLLGLVHRWRNRRTLTVIMFHRVLTPDDPRWASCDPDYTLERALFAQCLEFFRRHYHVVDVAAVLAARRGGPPLPPRALLITFDDGWQDNVDHALPELRRADLPGVLFLVADAVGRGQPFFQERLVAAWRRGAVKVDDLRALLLRHGYAAPEGESEDVGALRRAIAALEAVPVAERAPLLAELGPRLDDGLRHMVDDGALHRLRAGGVEIGLHGKTHEPMTRAPDLDAELAGARAEVGARLGQPAPVTMSFPHGRFDARIAARAREAGYELVFTSVPALNATREGPDWLLARLGFETGAIVDASGRFRPDLLALYLFRRESRRLAA